MYIVNRPLEFVGKDGKNGGHYETEKPALFDFVMAARLYFTMISTHPVKRGVS